MKNVLIERIAKLKDDNNFLEAQKKNCIDLEQLDITQSIIFRNNTRINECEFLLTFIKD